MTGAYRQRMENEAFAPTPYYLVLRLEMGLQALEAELEAFMCDGLALGIHLWEDGPQNVLRAHFPSLSLQANQHGAGPLTLLLSGEDGGVFEQFLGNFCWEPLEEPRALELRPVRESDLSGLYQMVEEIFASYGLQVDPEFDAPGLQQAHLLAQKTGGEFWVLVEGDQVRASCALWLLQEWAELKTLYVHPSLRRMGWGARITNLVTLRSRASGRPELQLWSDTRFESAHRLYRRLGFEPMGERALDDINDSREYGFRMSLTSLR